MPSHEPPDHTPSLHGLGNFCAAKKARAVEIMPKALASENEERAARARAYYEKMHPLHPTDPFGLERMERVKTDVGVERLCNQLMHEHLGEPTRAQRRALRAEIREPGLAAEKVDRNAYRHPENRQRCPRLT